MSKTTKKSLQQKAQKYLLDNDLDDLLLNRSLYSLNTPENAKHWKYVSDVMVDFSNNLENSIPKIAEVILRQLFKDNFDIYGDSEGDVVMALTEDGFIKLFNLVTEEK